MPRVSVYQDLKKFREKVWRRISTLEEILEDYVTPERIEKFKEQLNEAVSSTGNGNDLYFYLKVMKRTKNLSKNSVEGLLKDWCFLLTLYVTLDAWGMNAGERRLKSFEDFQRNLQDSYTPQGLKPYKLVKQLTGCKIENFSKVKGSVEELYGLINPYKENTDKLKIVGRSKLLHFLLPNLVMPIDRKYVLSYLGLNEINKIRKYNQITEVEAFLTIQEVIGDFARKHKNRLEELLDNKWNQTIPKVIDNLIIYYCKNHQDTM